MYAIIAHSGKQFHVKPGLKFNVEKISHAVGEEVKLEHVLMMYDGKDVLVGTPQIDGKAVLVRVIEHGLGDKVKIIKFKRRKHHLKRQGHRQAYTRLEVLAIGDKKTVKAPAVAAEKKTPAKATTEKKAVSKKSAEVTDAKKTTAKAQSDNSTKVSKKTTAAQKATS